jgi:hypothetical protein
MGINNMYNITVCDKAWPDIYLRGLMGINNMYNITAWPDIYLKGLMGINNMYNITNFIISGLDCRPF